MPSHRAKVQKLPAAVARRLATLALLAALLLGFMQWASVQPLRQLDSFIYDTFIALGAKDVPDSQVVLVNVDDNTLSEVGQWPWPRYKLAQLLEKINISQPKSIGMDVIFPEPDRTSLTSLSQAYRKDFGLELNLGNIPQELLDNDVYLGAVMAEYGVVGSLHFLFDQVNRSAIQVEVPKGIRLEGESAQLTLEQAPGLLQNTFKIQSQLKYNGYITIKPDYDGKTRRLPLLMRYQDQVYPHLLLAGLMRMANTDTVTVSHDSLGVLLRVGKYTIPVDNNGAMLLRYRRAAQDYPVVSALDVLRSDVPIPVLAGKLVYVGSSAAGLNDLINTPVDTQFSGLNLYAVGLGNILNGDCLREPSWSGVASLMLSLICGGIIAALFVVSVRLSVLVSGAASLLALVVLASAWLATQSGVYLSPAAGVASIMVCFSLLSMARLTIERQRAFASLELVSNTQRVAIESMAAVAETRDPETGGHIKRTQSYVKALAEQLVREGKFLDVLTPEFVEWLFLSAPLHDIGKVGVHDNILLKPGRLDEFEFGEMKQHARFGQEIIAATSKGIQGDNFLRVAGEIASYHHEKWDGSGYPYGLAREAIPLSARLMSVADVYDALISKRCYKPAFSHQTAREILLEKRGSDFDPVVIDAFFTIEDEIVAIAQRFVDEHPDQVDAVL